MAVCGVTGLLYGIWWLRPANPYSKVCIEIFKFCLIFFLKKENNTNKFDTKTLRKKIFEKKNFRKKKFFEKKTFEKKNF